MFAADKIVAAIKDRPMTSKEIAEVTGVPQGTVWNTLKKMSDEGKIEKIKNPKNPRLGLYKLTESFKPSAGTPKPVSEPKTRAELLNIVHRKLWEIGSLLARIEKAA